MIGYETVFITHPDLEEEVLKKSLKKFKDLIKKAKGKVVHEHFWGRRRMAYSIANQKYGVYHIWYLEGSGTMLDELQTQFRYSDDVVRFHLLLGGYRSQATPLSRPLWSQGALSWFDSAAQHPLRSGNHVFQGDHLFGL